MSEEISTANCSNRQRKTTTSSKTKEDSSLTTKVIYEHGIDAYTLIIKNLAGYGAPAA
ncbi:MAG TPA: hypothetical protein VJZ32_10405 [Candidatus Bathyarchaeia archaeon]|nr:hypothetical protein [Candidatus Bathyarchaeia archaeon]